jgi:hypothetical protein
MSALHLHIETVFDEPELVVLRTSTEPQESTVVMLVRLDRLHDTVLMMLDALTVPEDAPHCATKKRTNE